MKIKRYESVGGTKIQSNRSLSTGTAGSNALAQIGASAISSVLQYGASQNALTAKLRRLEIQTNIENGTTGITNDTQIFNDATKESKFWATPDVWLKEYEKNKPKWEKKYKESMDEQSWKEFKPFFWRKVFEQEKNLRELVNDQKVNNGVTALEQSSVRYDNDLATATSSTAIKSAYENYTKLTLPRFTNLLIGTEQYTAAIATAENKANNALIYLTASDGVITTDPNGRTVKDHKAILANLKNPNYKILDINGKEVGVKHPVRQKLIENEGTAATNQDSIWKKVRTENAINDYKSFNKELVAFLNGDTANMDSFLGRLENNKNLSASEISALRTAFKTTQTHIASGTSTWDSAAGMQTKAVLTFMVNMGVIDTKSELQVINNAQLNGLLEPDYATKLMDNAKKYTKERNKIKFTMTKNAIAMVTKELNIDGDIWKEFEEQVAANPDMGGEEKFGLLFGIAQNSRNPKEAYEALLNISQLLADGEKGGFTWKEMLLDKGGANYILDDIIAVHKENIDKAHTVAWTKGLDNDQEDASVKILGGSYFISEDYFTNKTSTVTKIEMPQRLKGESILDYTKRIGNIVPKDDNPFFPSWVSNDMSVGDLDVSGILVTGAK